MRKRTIAIIGGAAVLAAAWGVFRPERLFITARVDERFPAATADAGARPLLSGAFRGLAHETAGTATIHRLADGRRVLRLTGFRTSNGPDVRVYLVAAPDAPDNETVKKAGFVELGKLKGNEGDQNYDVPAEVDLGRYRSVSIWCARFGVNFGAAPLAPAPGAQAVQGGSNVDQRPL
jgi:hypothetical protein